MNTVENDETILNCLRLMKTYIMRFDKEHLAPELKRFLENLSPQEQGNTRAITIKLEPGEVRHEVVVNLNCQFWELMRQSAAVLNLKMSEFFIYTKQGPLAEEVYSYPMKNYDIKEVVLGQVPIDRMEKEFPSFIIGYS